MKNKPRRFYKTELFICNLDMKKVIKGGKESLLYTFLTVTPEDVEVTFSTYSDSPRMALLEETIFGSSDYDTYLDFIGKTVSATVFENINDFGNLELNADYFEPSEVHHFMIEYYAIPKIW